ncbi:MAG: hypothetical protein ACM34M_10435 [Ignavibacteria bacterium]
MFNSKSFIVSFLPAILVFSSCSDTITNYYDKHTTIIDSLRWDNYKDIADIVTDVPSSIFTYSEMSSLQRGTIMKLRVNREDYQVWEVDVVFDALYREGSERLILCHTPSVFPIGAGDSGSPLLTPEGKVAGILCYGYYGNSNDFAARAIEDVINIDGSTAASGSNSGLFTVIQPLYITTGLNKEAAERYPSIKSLIEKSTITKENPVQNKQGFFKTSQNLTIQGSSIAIIYVSGDFVLAGAVGTISYFLNEKIYAFGHEYLTFAAAPAYLASAKSFISSYDRSIKMAEPSNELVGSFVKNHYNGILIDRNAVPQVVKLNTICSIKGENIFSYNHQLSNSLNFDSDVITSSDLSCYLIYLRALESNNLSNINMKANCNLEIITDKDSFAVPFFVEGQGIDWAIYSYISQNIQFNDNERRLMNFNLTVSLSY